MSDYRLTYVSLGAGVQSSALLVMATLGLHGCPKPDLVLFADTQDEPPWVYKYLKVLHLWAEQHGVYVGSCTAGRLADETLGKTGKKRRAALPVFTTGADGREAMLPRQCTEEYKLAPIRRTLRRWMDIGPRKRVPVRSVQALIGISFDERDRMKDSRHKWIVNRYPLVEAVMRRHDCERLLQAHGLPIPKKSACIYCPFHDDRYWVDLRETEPASFALACDFDDAIRSSSRGLRHPVYLHRSLIPLRDVSFDATQQQPDMFRNECEGVCGV